MRDLAWFMGGTALGMAVAIYWYHKLYRAAIDCLRETSRMLAPDGEIKSDKSES